MKKKNTPDSLDAALDQVVAPQGQDLIQVVEPGHLLIGDEPYQVLVDYGDAFDLEAFKDRYQPYFETFDYIVGDWAFEQLRLRGFYQLNRRRVPRDRKINFLDDYLKEFCNFGAAYFVLAKEESVDHYAEELEKYHRYRAQKASFPPKGRRSKKKGHSKQGKSRFKIKQRGGSQ